MAQHDFLERFMELDRSHQVFRCLGVLAGPRDTLQPHQLQLHAEAKRALFWHLDGMSTTPTSLPQESSSTHLTIDPSRKQHAQSHEQMLQELREWLLPVDTSPWRA